MATYSAITAGEIDADSPITAALAGKWTDNPIAMHKYLRRSSDSSTNATSTLADDGYLQFTAAASTTYDVTFHTWLAGGNTGAKVAIKMPAGSTFSVQHIIFEKANTSLATVAGGTYEEIGSYFTVTDDDPIAITSTSGQYFSVLSHAIVTTVGSGDVKLRFAMQTVNSLSIKVLTGSWMTYHMMDAV